MQKKKEDGTIDGEVNSAHGFDQQIYGVYPQLSNIRCGPTVAISRFIINNSDIVSISRRAGHVYFPADGWFSS